MWKLNFLLNDWRKGAGGERSETLCAETPQAQHTLEAVLGCFDTPCTPQEELNGGKIIYLLDQAAGEGVDDYSMNLSVLAASCNFWNI